MESQIKKFIEENIEQTINIQCKKYKLLEINPYLYKSIKEYSLRKGKRIRPILFVLSYIGYSDSQKEISQSIYNVSTAIEFLHNFMLIHDDIIDNSHLRRGKPTMHKLLQKAAKTIKKEELGNSLAIIAGDIIYAFAIEAFLSVEGNSKRKEKALHYFLETTTITAMGELIDTIQGVTDLNQVKENDVFLNYSLKTARYTFNSPLVIGAILAGANNKEIQKLSQLSLEIGQAFQIQDDVIGIFDTEKKIGKSILSDLEESKKTLLVCHCYHRLNTKGKQSFIKVFNKKNKTFKDLLWIRAVFIKEGSLIYCLKEVEARFNKTLTLIATLKLKNPSKSFIVNNFIQLFSPSERIANKYKIPIFLKKN